MASFFHQPEGLVEVGAIGTQGEEEPCKIIISLLSLERESKQGMSVTTASGHFVTISSPPIHANLNVLIAAVFSDKRYREELSFLSQALTFMQITSSLAVGGNKYTIELLSPTLQDQSNIWTQFGGKYYPSVVCKIRRLTFDAGEVQRGAIEVSGNQNNVGQV
ncbi:MAG: DUF4255 domain-containing protein [Bacteroides sp.]|nr:DUF4255 domain-containing protein [Bacteroides sp.]